MWIARRVTPWNWMGYQGEKRERIEGSAWLRVANGRSLCLKIPVESIDSHRIRSKTAPPNRETEMSRIYSVY